MARKAYRSIRTGTGVDRREFLKVGGAVGAGLVLGVPALRAQDEEKQTPPGKPKTNVDEALAVPRTERSLPGAYPGKVVEVHDPEAMADDKPQADVIRAMFQRGMERLTGEDLASCFGRFFDKADVIGIKVNPVGSGLISTRLEVVDAIIDWLVAGGVERNNIIIWDRFDYMLADAGFTPERYPGIGIEGLQTMDEAAASGEKEDDSAWLDEKGNHVSASKFDEKVFYWVDVEGPKDDKAYLNQHVFSGKQSNFGRLLTQRLTKIINVPVLKNAGNGISVASKNIGYGAICNTGRLHRPLFFDVCTEVLAFPVIRDKLVLNIADGLRAQYDGGPMATADFAYLYNTLFFATDPFAMDMVCHQIMVEKRKSMGIEVNEHPMFTGYLRYAEKLGLGVVSAEKLEHVRV
jgi:hypothetical protein